jgi:hypothetical protein
LFGSPPHLLCAVKAGFPFLKRGLVTALIGMRALYLAPAILNGVFEKTL